MPGRADIWNLVERAAVERGLPRLDLWQKVASAIEQGDLKIQYEPAFPSTPVYPPWITGFRRSVDRHNDPGGCAHLLKLITVSIPLFHKWLPAAYKLPRGPIRKSTGYEEADRKRFSEISKLRKSGERSDTSAALKLVNEGKVVGSGTPLSKAKRLVEGTTRNAAIGYAETF